MIRRPLNAMARAVARLAGVQPAPYAAKKPAASAPGSGVCKSEREHRWEARWLGDEVAYFRCAECGEIRETFDDVPAVITAASRDDVSSARTLIGGNPQ